MLVTRVVGALISAGGVAVASPPGTRHAAALLRDNVEEGRAAATQALRKILRVKPKTIHVYAHYTTQAHSSGSGRSNVHGRARGLADPTIEDRVRLLEEHVQRVDEAMTGLQQQASQDRAAQQAAIISLRDELTTSIAALTARLDASEDRAMQTDARALFIAVLGILLLNFAAEVACLPLLPWLLLIAGSVALCVKVGRSAWRAGMPTLASAAERAVGRWSGVAPERRARVRPSGAGVGVQEQGGVAEHPVVELAHGGETRTATELPSDGS